MHFPRRIVCLTEEAVEILFALGEGHRVVGVSAYVERPVQAKKLPVVCAFTGGNVKKVRDLNPDLVLGFSDIQKDFARDLIGAGLNVFIANHRSLEEILAYIRLIANMVGKQREGELYLEQIELKIKKARAFASSLTIKPKVYIEEWDEPRICAIRWFHELVELCGGDSITKSQSMGSLAKERFIEDQFVIDANPDIILACWCGKKVDKDSISKREGYSELKAIKKGNLFELDPAVFLQPGPAPLVTGIDTLCEIFSSWQTASS